MSALEDFATWEPLLRLMREELKGLEGRASGFVGSGSWSVPVARPAPVPGRASLVSDMQAEWDAVERVRDALDGRESVPFVADFAADGRVALHLVGFGDSAEDGIGGAAPGGIVLVEGSVPAPWRRLPEPYPDAVPAPGADAALLERTLRERLPDAVGASDEEIAAAEERLGIPLPEELKAAYRVTRDGWGDEAYEDDDEDEDEDDAIFFYLVPLSHLYVADAKSRPAPWEHGATESISTAPDAAVQGLVGSPGWIAFGDNGGGDPYAIDLTPGPNGHLGQVIQLSHELYCGARLVSDSLTDMAVHSRRTSVLNGLGPELTAHVNHVSLRSVEEAAFAELEVLCLGVWNQDDEPFSLAPVFDCARLRTLTAYAGTLADPLEIQRLKHLEYLELVPEDWRVLLDANAVPRTLLAAKIGGYGNDPLEVVSLANELLALFGRPLIGRTIIEGVL